MKNDDLRRTLQSESLHIMEKGEIRDFGVLAGEAYSLDYPIYPFMFGDSNSTKKVVDMFISNYNTIFRYGMCVSFKDTSLGNAAILPPEHRVIPMKDYILTGAWKIVFKYKPSAVKRITAYEDYCHDIMDKYADDSTWYMQNVAICKNHQGQGLGTKLLSPILGCLDDLGSSCFLETHTKSNVRFYEHMGFELMEVGHLPGTDIEHYAMFRAPSESGN